MPQTQERPAALRHRGAVQQGRLFGRLSVDTRIWRRLSLSNRIGRALRAIVGLRPLVHQALNNRFRYTESLTNPFQGV